MKQASELKAAQVKAQRLAQHAAHSRLQSPPADPAPSSWHTAWSSGCTSTKTASSFKPFAKDPEKQKRYEEFLANVKRGQKGGWLCWPKAHIPGKGSARPGRDLQPWS